MYPERSQLIEGSGKPKILLVKFISGWEFACFKKIAATGSSCINSYFFFFAATTNSVDRAY